MGPMGRIHLDHHASTPLDARVLAALMPFFT
jgi:cysteine sulfinate desulfinase/cysteine desulfurase-like protein